MNRLKELRLSKGLTLAELAKALEMDYSTLGHIERGRRNFSIESLNKACAFFGVSTDFMLGMSLEDIFANIADTHYGDCTAIRLSKEGEPVEVYRDGSLPVCLKFAIIKALKDVDNVQSLEAILTLVKTEQAKADFN